MEHRRWKLDLRLSDAYGNNYSADLLNDRLLDQLNLKQEDIKEVKPSFKDMPGYFYEENINGLGNTIVGGGSLGFDIITYSKGTYEIQPFLRYDKGHEYGLKTEHMNPKLRVVHNQKEWYLPEGNGTNIFGRDFHTLQIAYPFEWAIDTEEKNEILKGKVVKKIKRKPPNSKKYLGDNYRKLDFYL